MFHVTFWKFSGSVGRKKSFSVKKSYIRFGNDTMNNQCKCWSVKLTLILQLCFYNKFRCNAAVCIWSSSSKIKGKDRKAVYFTENMARNRFLPKSQKNFFGSRVFDMGRSSYMKHEYFFPWPNNFRDFSVLDPKDMFHCHTYQFLEVCIPQVHESIGS